MEKRFYVQGSPVCSFWILIPGSSSLERSSQVAAARIAPVPPRTAGGEAGLRFLAKFMMIKRSVRPEVRRLH